jgi:hypothetical protein
LIKVAAESQPEKPADNGDILFHRMPTRRHAAAVRMFRTKNIWRSDFEGSEQYGKLRTGG